MNSKIFTNNHLKLEAPYFMACFKTQDNTSMTNQNKNNIMDLQTPKTKFLLLLHRKNLIAMSMANVAALNIKNNASILSTS